MATKKKADPFKFLDRLDKGDDAPSPDEAKVKTKQGGRVQADTNSNAGVPDLGSINPDVAVMIDPSTVTTWRFANRMYFDPETLSAIKESITASGQHQPALVRPLDADDPRAEAGRYSYELIYGAQRLRAVVDLGITLRAVIADIGDREAALAMDAENRARADITVYERACDYARWLESGLFRSASDICDASGSSRGTVSKLLRIAELPREVAEAFPSFADLSFSYGYDLACAVGDSAPARDALIEEARHLCGVPGSAVDVETRKRRLMAVAQQRKDATKADTSAVAFDIKPINVTDAKGRTFARLNVSRLGEVKLRTRQLEDEAQVRAVSDAIRKALDAFRD